MEKLTGKLKGIKLDLEADGRRSARLGGTKYDDLGLCMGTGAAERIEQFLI